MRVVILIDGNNFERSFFSMSKGKGEFRYIDFHKINGFVMNYLRKNIQYSGASLTHLRTYFYTGEYTEKLIERIEKAIAKYGSMKALVDLLAKVKKGREKQEKFFRFAKNYYFFEMRTKPLQFSPSEGSIFQKGVDVQLAVDLVDFTHKNVFDIAVILSGDIDLLESVRAAKNNGKHIIILGDRSATSEEMKREADLFIDIGKLKKDELDAFSHIPDKSEAKNDAKI
jgi:uncharacterized LabA/DUF88 family protein